MKKQTTPARKSAASKNAGAAKRRSTTAAGGKGAKPAPVAKRSTSTTQRSQTSRSRTGANSKKTTARTAGGKVPQGRTLTTLDKYLDERAKNPNKSRPIVVIEVNDKNELAVVQLSSRNGKNRTKLKNYEQGQSYFKHFVEIEDNEGNPIRINFKFKENHPNIDVSRQDVDTIIDTVFNHSKTMQKNRKRINKFRGKKN